MFFGATEPASGTELWSSEGTAAGTRLVRNINLGSGSSAPSSLTKIAGTIFFSAYDGNTNHGRELWKVVP